MSEPDRDRERCADDSPEAEGATQADWALLGLAPGADERALRSAYARKLKTVKPEIDPEGFQALRASYERVRAVPSGASAPTEGADAAQAEADAVDPRERDDLVHRFDACRRRGDISGALAVVDGALSGSLRMAWRHAVEDGLFDSVAGDPSARRDLIQGLATRFDWREATTRQEARNPEAMAALRARIEAADFVDALRARERAARDGLGPAGDRVLLRLLEPYRVGLFDRALDPEEREVGIEMVNAVFDHLAEIDDVLDTRTIAALRGALGAAPFGKPLPERVTAGEAAQPTSQPAMNAPGKWRWSWAGGLWLMIVVLAAINGIQSQWRHGARDAGQTEQSRPAPRFRADRTPPVEMNFPIKERGGRLGLDLSPLLEATVRIQLAGVRFDSPGEDAGRTVTMDDLAASPIRYLPAGEHQTKLSLVFSNGDRTLWYAFDLHERVPPPASSQPPAEGGDAAGAPDDEADDKTESQSASRGPDSNIRFAPKLALTDGHFLIDLSDVVKESNLKSLRALRLRTAPGREAEILDVAAIKAQPRHEIPEDSERLTIQILYTNGGESREFVYDPKPVLAKLRQGLSHEVAPSDRKPAQQPEP